MKLFVIGATGRTGSEIVGQALSRGHQITAFVRSPEKITLRHERLSMIEGNIRDENQLFDALRGHDAVLSTLGATSPIKPTTLLRDSALATTHAMKRSGVKRLLILSSAAHFPDIPRVLRIFSFILRNPLLDSLSMEEVVRASDLDWTIVRPPFLTKENYFTYRSRENAAPSFGFSLSRKAVAAFMLDATEKKQHFRQIVGIAK
jgi:putative NADH-flavin reductase